MRFFSAKYFWILLLLPFISAFLFFSFRDTMKKLETFYGSLSSELIPEKSLNLHRLRIFLTISILLLIIIALARPQFGFRWVDRGNVDSDIIIALDMSKSMLAEDVYPNRLGDAKRQVMDLISVLSGDRVGLMVFAGNSYLVCPLTSDYASVRSYVNDIDISMISSEGTSFGRMMIKSANSFDLEDVNAKTLVIFSDGEDHSDDAVSVAKDIFKRGIKICCIAIGREKGALIPLSKGEFKKNINNEPIVTKMNPKMLEEIAAASGGAMLLSTDSDFDMVNFYAQEIRKEDYETKFFVSKVRVWNERYRWLLIPAMFLLLAEYFLEDVISFFPRRKGVLFVLMFSLLFPVSGYCTEKNISGEIVNALSLYDSAKYDEASEILLRCQVENPENLYIKYDLANCYYKLERFIDAERCYREIIRRTNDKALTEKCFYNLGNVSFKERKPLDALDYYERALKIDKSDFDARYNMDVVKRYIDRFNENLKLRESSGGEPVKGNSNGKDTLPEEKSDIYNNPKEEENRNDKKNAVSDNEINMDDWSKFKKGISLREAELFLDSIIDSKKRALTRQLYSVYQDFEDKPKKDW